MKQLVADELKSGEYADSLEQDAWRKQSLALVNDLNGLLPDYYSLKCAQEYQFTAF